MAHAEAMEVQRQGFQFEQEKVKEKLKLAQSKLKTLEKKLGLLKASKVTKAKRLTRNILMARIVFTTYENKIEKEERMMQAQDKKDVSSTAISIGFGNKPGTEKRSFALIAISKSLQSPKKL